MPAQAGIQTKLWGSSDPNILDSRIRRNDGFRKPVAGKYVTVIAKGSTKLGFLRWVSSAGFAEPALDG